MLCLDYEKEYARTTVVTFLERLKNKGYVSTYRKSKFSYVHADVTEEEYKKYMLHYILDFWFEGDQKNLKNFIKENL